MAELSRLKTRLFAFRCSVVSIGSLCKPRQGIPVGTAAVHQCVRSTGVRMYSRSLPISALTCAGPWWWRDRGNWDASKKASFLPLLKKKSALVQFFLWLRMNPFQMESKIKLNFHQTRFEDPRLTSENTCKTSRVSAKHNQKDVI